MKEFSKLKYENLNGHNFCLLESLRYDSAIAGEIVVPKGFVFDNESIPRIPFLYAWIGRTSDRAGCVHDYLYRIMSRPKVDRKTADRVYREANKVRGISWIARNAKYIGVRFGGAGSYQKKTVKSLS